MEGEVGSALSGRDGSPATSMHRILMAPVATGVPPADAHRHWRDRHSQVVPKIDGLVGYVQNRPLPEFWDRPYLVCAESWFTSREAESDAYASGYYRDTVVVDEERFIDRERAWHSPIVATRVILDGPRFGFRALVFGAEGGDLADGDWSRVESLELRRPIAAGLAPTILAAWSADRDAALGLVDRDDGHSFVAAPEAVVPPGPEWRGAGMEWSW